MYKFDRKGFSFAHSRNLDGTFNSICSRCFRRIAESAGELDLDSEEDSHVCIPSLVIHYRWLSKAVSAYRIRGHRNRSSYPSHHRKVG